MAKKISRKSKRRLFILAPISLFTIAFFIFTSISYVVNIIELTNQEKQLKEKLIALELEEEDLNDEIIKLKDPDYIAKYAREKYYYSKDGEYVIKITEKDDDIITENKNKNYKNYIIYSGCLILFIILVFILKRRKSE